MASPLNPPRNVGPITYISPLHDSPKDSLYNRTKTYTVTWPYFSYDNKGRNALQRAALGITGYLKEYGLGGQKELDERAVAAAIQAALDKFDNDAVKKASADRKAANDAAYAAMVARNYAQAATAPTTVITVSNPISPPITPFTTNKPTLATKVIVITAKKNSKKAIKAVPEPPNKPKLPSPKKPTPNKNPTIPPPPPPPPPSPPLFPSDPDKTMQRPCPMCIASLDPNNKSYCPPCEPCSPGWYVGPEGECLKCALKGYVKGSKCAPCPPGTTGESIHTGCSQIGPDGKSYTFIA
jgi:hypothetical protein